MRAPRYLVVATVAILIGIGSTAAQEVRTAPTIPPHEAGGPAKAGPHEQSATATDQTSVEKVRTYVEKKGLIDRFTSGDGWYPRIGGMTTGSGLALGGGYRKHLADDLFVVDLSGALSTRLYKAVDAKLRWPTAWRDRIEISTIVRYRDYLQEDFFGIGGSSARTARTNYALESTDINARGLVKLLPWLHVGADIGRFRPAIGRGTDDSWPSTHDLFTDADAPGLAAQPAFLYTTMFIEADYRDVPGNPRQGGFARASWASWNDQDLQRYDFRRFDGEAAHFFPTWPKQVVAVHAGIAYVNNETAHRVPFYFLPYMGGSDTLRGFEEFRFRDENVLYLTGEYRWDVFSLLEAAVFVDAGEARTDWEDIDLADWKTSYGAGVRVKATKHTFVRLDVGTGGGEGVQVFLKFGKSF